MPRPPVRCSVVLFRDCKASMEQSQDHTVTLSQGANRTNEGETAGEGPREHSSSCKPPGDSSFGTRRYGIAFFLLGLLWFHSFPERGYQLLLSKLQFSLENLSAGTLCGPVWPSQSREDWACVVRTAFGNILSIQISSRRNI